MNRFYNINLAAKDEKAGLAVNSKAKLPYIPWGADNLFPLKFLDQLAHNSFYNRVCTTYASMIAGEGLVFEGKDAAFAEILAKKWGLNSKFIEKAAWDVAVLNAFSCQILKDINSNNIAKVLHVPAASVRVGQPDEWLQVNSYFTAYDWSLINAQGKVSHAVNKQYRQSVLYKEYPAWHAATLEKNTLIFNCKYSPVMLYYPLPAAEAAFEVMELSNLVTRYQASLLKNTITNSMIITIPRTAIGDEALDEKEMQKEIDAIQEKLAGTGEAGKAIIIFHDPDAPAPTIHPPVQDSNDKRYVDMSEAVKFNLMSGLGVVSPEIFGMPSAGGFSSQADMMRTANELTHLNVIAPLQVLITEVVQSLLESEGLECKVSIKNRLFLKEDDKLL